jgi:hypothetical protein
MTVFFKTSDPNGLLKAFNGRINQEEPKGKITTWERDAQGDYTHKAQQWRNKAWFRPVVEPGGLRFNILGHKEIKTRGEIYGYYHGHLIETFLNHFDTLFTEAVSSAQAVRPGDIMT